MDCLAFLERARPAKVLPVYFLTGDEDFLKRQVVAKLRALIFGTDADEFGLSSYAGASAVFATVRNELETAPFLTPRRLVVIEQADPFVTNYRAALEKYVAEPVPTATLVLDVKSLPGHTKLAKLVDDAAVIACVAPAKNLPAWCVRWAASKHQKKLAPPAAELLVDLVGPEMGLLDQELTKLAIYVGTESRIEAADVDKLVGRSREEETFKIFDAIGNGQTAAALALLDELFNQGDEPLKILAAFSYQLRRLVQVARLHQQGRSLAAAFEQLKIVYPSQRQKYEQQLRHLGPARVNQLYSWLLETDLGLKGANQLPARTLLERLVIRLARREKTEQPWP